MIIEKWFFPSLSNMFVNILLKKIPINIIPIYKELFLLFSSSFL